MATLWTFEWSRGIATAMADVPVGLMIGGAASAFTIAMLATSVQGALLIVLAPEEVGADSAISTGLMVLSIRPAGRFAGNLGKIKG